jgi:dihydroorotate dehydrogenase
MAFYGRIGHIEGIESPWGNAGGVVKTIEDVEMMAKTGVGWIEGGSYTLERRFGNDRDQETGEHLDLTVWHYDRETGTMTNSLGMPNVGFNKDNEDLESIEEQLPEMIRIAHAYGKPFLLNVAPVSNEPIEETKELVRRGYAQGVDGVLVNAGCPNVVTTDGGRHELLSRSEDGLRGVLNGLAEVVQRYKPVAVRVSPLRGLGLENIATVVAESGVVSAVFTPNTWPGHKPVDTEGKPILGVPGNVGGASGPAFANKAIVETQMWVEALKGSDIDVVRSSGVMEAYEIQRGLSVGAVACAGTTFFYISENGWAEDTSRLLHDLAA